MFQSFGEESSTLLLVFYLFLGFCGFFLLILLLSIILITLSEDDKILSNINTEDEEEINTFEASEVEKDVENCDKIIKGLRQSEQIPNGLLTKGQQMIILFCKLFKNIIQLPVVSYFHFVQWTMQINNDFIRIE